MTLVLLLTLAVIAAPPTIARLFDDELRADNYCREEVPASADEYVMESRQGSYACTYRRNGRVISILTVND